MKDQETAAANGINPDFAMQNLPRPRGLGQPIKPRRGLIATVEVNPDFILHNLVHKFIDDIAACIEKSGFNEEYMLELVRARMPFGKYKDVLLVDLPETYIMWFARKGFPKGKLGGMLQSMYEIKLNGLGYLLEPLR